MEKVLQTISGKCFKNHPIKSVYRKKNNVRLYYGKSDEYFDYDKVIFATHADDTLKLIKNPTETEKSVLNNFQYKKNVAFLHTDEKLMPDNKKVWSSWNSILDKKNMNKNCVTYWLNTLQNLKTKKNYFLTLNPYLLLDDHKIIKKINFTHPFYNLRAIEAQKN